MIIPFFDGLWIGFRRAPMTWALIFSNVLIYLLFFNGQMKIQKSMAEVLERGSFMRTQGEVFAQHVESHAAIYSSVIRQMAASVRSRGDVDQARLLGQLAFRDHSFMTASLGESFSGDDVAIDTWRKDVRKIASLQERHLSYQLGLSPINDGKDSWVTYQFVHGSFGHLATNMAFLLLVGGALEPIVGGSTVLLVYLVGGFIGAWAFLLFSGLSAVPLVGASGSVSGLMGAFIGYQWKKSIRFFYVLFPAQGYWGYLYLPAWLTLAYWMVSDLSGLIGTLPETGGVAHAAHIGGILFGLVFGHVLRLQLKTRQSFTS